MSARVKASIIEGRAVVAHSHKTPTVPEPKFMLTLKSMLMLCGVEYQVERRNPEPDGRWQLLSIAEGTPILKTDRQLADHLAANEFHIPFERGMRLFAPPPLSPIAIGEKAKAANLRKHAYVQACLDAPGGLVRSRPKLMPVIKACAEERNEPPPGFSTVLSWLCEYERYGEVYGTAAYSDRHDLKGGAGSRLLDYQERAIEYGIERWLELGHKAKAYALVEKFIRDFDDKEGDLLDKDALGPTYVDDGRRLIPPSLRTFERRCANVDPMVRAWALRGPAYAKQRYRTYQTTAVPDRPYAEVEVDHCKLDILVVDESGLVLGRPDLIAFRDRATAMIVGIGLGFEEPSYASFVQGLKHAMYPKSLDHYPSIKNPWPCFGRIENLIVDNALHFLGDNIQEAARELGMHIIPCAPRQPWLKGGLERFFGSANTGLLHSLPGTTLQNIVERRDHENLGKATLTLAELEFLLTYWICDVYHASPRKALGPIRGVGAVPLLEWAEKSKKFHTALPPHEDVFMDLAGDVDYRTIQKDGIVWDYIKYESEDLWSFLRDPEHNKGKGVGTTKYKVVRNPFDLGEITVVNHHRNKVLRIPATRGHHTYATGLTLHQHAVIVANARHKASEKVTIEALQAAKARLAEIVSALRKHPSRDKIQRAVARYMHTESSRRRQSEMTGVTKLPKHAALPDYSLSRAPAASKADHDDGRVQGSGTTVQPDEDDDIALSRSTMRAYRD
jgi:putative transposase